MNLATGTSFINLLMALVLVLSSTSVSTVSDTGGGQEDIRHHHKSKGKLNTITPAPPQPPLKAGPRVDIIHSGNVSTVLGRRASLRCRVLNRGNTTVSWIRHRDLHLLTVDKYTYTSDQRFQAMYEPSTGDWILLVGSVQLRDRGVYECQIGTTPPINHFITLHIIEPRTEILGGGDLHINTGSTINLTCLVLYHARSPHTLTWLHGAKEVHYNSPRGGVSVLTEAGEVTRSALLMQKATLKDAGNYTCKPTGAAEATTRVHVLHGEHHAAMQGGAAVGGIPEALGALLLVGVWTSWAGLPAHFALWSSLWTSLLLAWAILPFHVWEQFLTHLLSFQPT